MGAACDRGRAGGVDGGEKVRLRAPSSHSRVVAPHRARVGSEANGRRRSGLASEVGRRRSIQRNGVEVCAPLPELQESAEHARSGRAGAATRHVDAFTRRWWRSAEADLDRPAPIWQASVASDTGRMHSARRYRALRCSVFQMWRAPEHLSSEVAAFANHARSETVESQGIRARVLVQSYTGHADCLLPMSCSRAAALNDVN